MMLFDWIAGIGCALAALIVFALHVFTGPKAKVCMNLPEYVRWGLGVTGLTFMVRGVNFVTLRRDQLGHVNAFGLVALAALIYTFGAWAFWVFALRLPNQGWARLQWFQGLMRRNPDLVPVGMTTTEVVETHRALGAVVAEAPEPSPRPEA